MPDYPFTVFSILAAFSCIEPAIVIWKSSSASRPWSGLFLLGWIFVYNIFSFVDSIIWSSDSTDEWLDGRGYCDVSSTLKTIFSIGVLGSIIGISRFLIVAIKDNISQEENVPRNKWRTILEDGFLSLFLPALFIILTFMVESSRYAIVGVLGCRSILDQSWLSIVLYFIWPPIFGLIALAYTVFVLHRWRLHRKHLNQNWSLEKPNGPSKLLFQRLVITVIFEVIIFLSYSFYVLINFLITRTDIEFSWDRVHGSDWDIILKVPQQYASWPSWIGIISATFPILFIPLTPRIRLFFQIRKQRKQAKQLPPPIELQRTNSTRGHWFRFDDEDLDIKNRSSDEIEDGRQTQLDDRMDVNRTVTRVSAGGIPVVEDEGWNFGVTVTKQVVVESQPRDHIV